MTTAEKVTTSVPGRRKDTAGKTTVADTVVATIAGIAARDVEGVHAMGGGGARAVGAVRDRVSRSQDHTRGVKVEVGEEQAALDLDIVVVYGVHIADVAADIRSARDQRGRADDRPGGRRDQHQRPRCECAG